MRKRPITITKIKCRPKLDGSSVAQIINYIEQTAKSSPKATITWGQLEKRFNYSRQALDKHEPIKLAYRSANTAALERQNEAIVGEDAIEPSSVAALKKALAKSHEECRTVKQKYADLLEYVAQFTRKAHEKNISLGGMTEDLPPEYQHAVLQITTATATQAKPHHNIDARPEEGLTALRR